MPAAVDSTMAGSTLLFPCFYVLPISNASRDLYPCTYIAYQTHINHSDSSLDTPSMEIANVYVLKSIFYTSHVEIANVCLPWLTINLNH
jgi:hypothetical protein